MIFYNGFNLLIDIALVSATFIITYNVTLNYVLKNHHKSPF